MHYTDALEWMQQGWRWWSGELADMAPAPVQRFFAPEAQTIWVDVRAENSSLLLASGAEQVVLGEVDLLGGSRDEISKFRQVLRSKPIQSHRALVAVAPDCLLSHRVYLPLAVLANLETVLRFELDRLTPYSPERAAMAYGNVEVLDAEERIALDLHVAEHAFIGQLLENLALLGLVPEGIYPSADVTAGENPEASLNFMPVLSPESSGFGWSARERKALGLTALGLMLVLLFPAWMLGQQETGLSNEIGLLREQAEAIATKRNLINNRILAEQTLTERKSQSSSALQMLDELTQLLPDNTWVSRFRLEDNELSLRGESGKASDLIEILEQSPHFNNVQFKASVTRSPGNNWEQYEIGMQLVEAGK